MSEKKETANVMPIPTEKEFALSKVKTLKNGGLDVHYEVTETVGNESYTNKYHVESAKDIHPDLRNCFDRLRPIMGRIFNITSFLSLMDTPDMKSNKKQKDGCCLLAKIQVITNCVLSLLVNWLDWLKNQASAVGFASSYTTATGKR